jgi:hypothetical protein
MMLTKAFTAEGIPCSLEWLLYGEGPEPQILTKIPFSSASDNITQDLRQFIQSHANAVDAIVSDNGMAPCFLSGDHVAGIRHFAENLNKTMGLCCIVQVSTGEVLVRKIDPGNQPDLYTLSCVNSIDSVKYPILKDISVFSAAPVIWFRRPIKP